MPKKKADPKETPEAQHKRFKELARETGADKNAGAFERAFTQTVPPRALKDAGQASQKKKS
jgi:hypothetical protein